MDNDDDLLAELTHQMQMAQFMLQEDNKFDFPGIGSENLEPWESIDWSPQSTLWSPLCSKHGSSEGLSSKEPSPPTTPDNTRDWESVNDMVGMLEKMKLDERGSSKYHSGYGVGVCSDQSLFQEQIRATQMSRLRQQQIQSLRKKLTDHSHKSQQFQRKGKGVGVVDDDDAGFGNDNGNGRRNRQTRPGSLHQQTGSEMQAIFPGSSGSRATSCGTGVFLPRAGTNAPSSSESRNKRPGNKGCPTVLIPARVVQALQLHFDQIAATSGPTKPAGFPALNDVLVNNRNGLYSLQKRQSRRKPEHVQNDMILPREWTY